MPDTRVCYLDLDDRPNYFAEARFESVDAANEFAVSLVLDALSSKVWAEVRVEHGEFMTPHQVDVVRTSVDVFSHESRIFEASSRFRDF